LLCNVLQKTHVIIIYPDSDTRNASDNATRIFPAKKDRMRNDKRPFRA
jgi:hypothetical protein